MNNIHFFIQWYLTANVLLIVVWCFFVAIVFTARRFRISLDNRSLLIITRYLFLILLLLPVVPGTDMLPGGPESLIPVREGIKIASESAVHSIKRIYLPTIPARQSIGGLNQAHVYLCCFVLFSLAASIRLVLVLGSIRKLSALINSGCLWKKSGRLRIILVDDISIPFSTLVLGYFHIVLPSLLVTKPRDLKTVIRHEGIHHRHGDTLWLLVMEVMKLLFCLNPFIFLWTKSFEVLQENACDEALIKHGSISFKGYCHCLIGLNQSVADFNPVFVGVSTILRIPRFNSNPGNQLLRRIKMMSQLKQVRFSNLKMFLFAAPIFCIIVLFSFLTRESLFAESAANSASVGMETREPISPVSLKPDSTAITDKRVLLPMLPTRGRFTSAFGDRIDPFSGMTNFHPGIDISNRVGTPIESPLDGVVVFAAPKGNFGLLLTIDHGNGVITRYAKLSKILVPTGAKVRSGQRVALMGSSGRSTGPHLHFELIINDRKVDPIQYVTDPLKYIRDETGFIK